MLLLFYLIITSFIVSNTYAYNDLMEQAYEQSQAYEQVVNVWDTKQAVWNSVFYESTWIDCWTNEKISCSAVRRQSLLVYWIRLLLRFVIIIAVPFIIFNGVYLVIGVISGTVSKIFTYTYNVLIWIATVLSTIAIIQLIQSAIVATLLAQLFSFF